MEKKIKMGRYKVKFINLGLIIGLIIGISEAAYAITRSQVIQRGLTWEFTDNWTPAKDTVMFGTHTYKSNFTVGGTYNQEAYVYKGSDSESTFISRIGNGVCPGGMNIIEGSHSTKWFYTNGYASEVISKLAGIDCSAFVSACWGVSRTNTSGLANMCLQLSDRNELKPGDILDRPGYHVILALTKPNSGNINTAESASPPGYVIVRRNRLISSISSTYGAYTPFPTFSDFIPAEGEIINEATPEIKVTIKSGTNIKASSILMKIDGAPVSPSISPSTDATEILVSYTPTTNLSDGEHEVYVYAKNTLNFEDSIVHHFIVGLPKTGVIGMRLNATGDSPFWEIVPYANAAWGQEFSGNKDTGYIINPGKAPDLFHVTHGLIITNRNIAIDKNTVINANLIGAGGGLEYHYHGGPLGGTITGPMGLSMVSFFVLRAYDGNDNIICENTDYFMYGAENLRSEWILYWYWETIEGIEGMYVPANSVVANPSFNPSEQVLMTQIPPSYYTNVQGVKRWELILSFWVSGPPWARDIHDISCDDAAWFKYKVSGVDLINEKEDEITIGKIEVPAGKVKIQGGEKGYANPSKGEEVKIHFKAKSSGRVAVKIYTLRGQLVWEDSKQTDGEEDFITWGCKNSEGSVVSSGVYIIYVKGPGIKTTQKAAILR